MSLWNEIQTALGPRLSAELQAALGGEQPAAGPAQTAGTVVHVPVHDPALAQRVRILEAENRALKQAVAPPSYWSRLTDAEREFANKRLGAGRKTEQWREAFAWSVLKSQGRL